MFAFLFLFVFGGMTGVAVATTSLDVHWHDTYFVVAHFHFIMVGGTLTAFLAAVHYWFPKITGRMYPEKLGVVGACLVFGGFFITFFPQFLLGNAGMPRRYYYYAPAVPDAARRLDARRARPRLGVSRSPSRTSSWSLFVGRARARRTRGSRVAASGSPSRRRRSTTSTQSAGRSRWIRTLHDRPLEDARA